MPPLEDEIRRAFERVAAQTSIDPETSWARWSSDVDAPVSSARQWRTRGPLLAMAVTVLVVAGLVVVQRSRSGPGVPVAEAPAITFKVEPDLASPGEWVFLSGDKRYGFEAFLDRLVEGDTAIRLWMLQPTSSPELDPAPPVDLQEQPDAPRLPAFASASLSYFQLPHELQSGTYRLCRVAESAGAELCAQLRVVPTNTQAPVAQTSVAQSVPESTAPVGTTAPTTHPVPFTTPITDRLESWPSAPTETPSVDDIPRLLATAPMASFGVPVRTEDEGSSSATFTQVFADADRDILLSLHTSPARVDLTPADQRQPVPIEGWDDAYFTEGSGLRLVASDPSGFVILTGIGITPDEAVSTVAAMQRRTSGTPGWDLPTQAASLVEITGAWNGATAQRTLTWFDGDRVVAQMLTSPGHTDLISQALGAEFERVDVNGAIGWLNASDDRRAIVWSPEGTTFVVLGVVDPRIDPLTVARSVIEFSSSDYESATTTALPLGVGDGCDAGMFC
jgi:hypothetical protein